MIRKRVLTFRLGGYHIAVEQGAEQNVMVYNQFKDNLFPFREALFFNDKDESFPVINTRERLKMRLLQNNEDTCMLVLDDDEIKKTGFLLDEYLGMYSTPLRTIKKIRDVNNRIVKGTCKFNGIMHFIISFKQLFLNETITEFDPFKQQKDEYILIFD